MSKRQKVVKKVEIINPSIKDFYTTQELVQEPWFPIRSTMTVKKLIIQGKLEAYNISTSPRFKRYRISKKSVEKFMSELQTEHETGIKKVKSKKK